MQSIDNMHYVSNIFSLKLKCFFFTEGAVLTLWLVDGYNMDMEYGLIVSLPR